jgi:hypothetical protein
MREGQTEAGVGVILIDRFHVKKLLFFRMNRDFLRYRDFTCACLSWRKRNIFLRDTTTAEKCRGSQFCGLAHVCLKTRKNRERERERETFLS